MEDEYNNPPSASGKRPASQYYWGDWHRDLALQSCQLLARGLWHEMNCLMHQGAPYGHLTMPNGRPVSLGQLSNLAKISQRQCAKLLRELEDAGVFSRDTEGTIYSRRMVRDEALRNARGNGGKAGAEHGAKGADGGKKGGRPTESGKHSKAVSGEQQGGFKTPLSPGSKPPPSSSSSSSSSVAYATDAAGVDGATPTIGLTAESSKAAHWDAMLNLLCSQGQAEASGRALIGKLVSEHAATPGLVFEAIRLTVAEQPIGAKSFLVAICARLAGQQRGGSRVVSMGSAVAQRRADTLASLTDSSEHKTHATHRQHPIEVHATVIA